MTQVIVRGDPLSLSASNLIGEGGEAEVYRLDGSRALKLYKQAGHPQFAGNTPEAQALRRSAEERIAQLQNKLPQFPRGLPPRVIAPVDLVFDRASARSQIIGYTMPLVSGAYTLHELAKKSFRQSGGIDQGVVLEIFKDLHDTVSRLHQANVVIGDFNELNVLVKGSQAHLVDADSMQFGSFLCATYSPRYVDPLICDSKAKKPAMVRPHSKDTDWYAFALLLFECLLFVHPYGGVFRPALPADRVCPEERPLKRISVFNQDVQYPSAGVPLNSLPDVFADFYRSLLLSDARLPFPRHLLDNLCFKAGVAVYNLPLAAKEVVSGQATARRVFSTGGQILAVKLEGSRLRYIYHKDGRFLRENDSVVLAGALDPDIKFDIYGDGTLVSRGGQTFLLGLSPNPEPVSAERFRLGHSVFAANAGHYYFVGNGQLWQGSQSGLRQIDDVLTGQTRIFVGPSFGFGYYQAGDFRRAFLFDSEGRGKIAIDLPLINGKLIDVSCFFSDEALWVIVTDQESGRIVRHCTLIDRLGTILGSCRADDGDDSWLGQQGGKCAAAFPQSCGGRLETLLVATAAGIVQIERAGDRLVERKTYAATAAMVMPEDNLIFCQEGLYVWNSKEIRLITT